MSDKACDNVYLRVPGFTHYMEPPVFVDSLHYKAGQLYSESSYREAVRLGLAVLFLR